ncbi:NRAMP-like transporter smf-3, partial [Elasticomyces elasticus]
VIGSAIALNLLLNVPLVAGCALTIVDILIILILYSPSGSMRRIRAFELVVMALALGVVICFCIELSSIKDVSVGAVFRGYLPSSAIIRDQGIFLRCGILGATVMTNSLYLGSGVVQSRLRDFDATMGNVVPHELSHAGDMLKYRPSLAAVRSCLTYSTVELALFLFTSALFVNSAILVVTGTSLSSTAAVQTADLFGIHDLLSNSLAPAASTVFALARLLSGTSAGIVATIAGQMLSEGALSWTVKPWLRRLITRSISITPSIIIAAAVGKEGLSKALNYTQVVLSIILSFTSAQLIYFTSRNKYMTVAVGNDEGDEASDGHVAGQRVKMRNHWITSTCAVLIWLVIAIMNVALLVFVGLGKG